MFILNIRRAANPGQCNTYKSTAPFPAIDPGHFYGTGYNQRAEVKQVRHTLLPNDWVIDVFLGEPMAGLALKAEGGGSTNPVPWPKVLKRVAKKKAKKR